MCGHHVSNEVLRAVTERLCTTVRLGDLMMRYGGDEFVVASKTALRGRLEALFAVPVTTSARLVQVPADICGDAPTRR